MKPALAILRHPGRLTCEERENVKREVESIISDGCRALVLQEGMAMWIVGDDGKLYDLNNISDGSDGVFRTISADIWIILAYAGITRMETIGPFGSQDECNRWIAVNRLEDVSYMPQRVTDSHDVEMHYDAIKRLDAATRKAKR